MIEASIVAPSQHGCAGKLDICRKCGEQKINIVNLCQWYNFFCFLVLCTGPLWLGAYAPKRKLLGIVGGKRSSSLGCGMTASVQGVSSNSLIVAVAMALIVTGCHAKAIHEQGGPRRVWQWESEDDPYEKYVEASMQKEGGNVVVTCTLPTIQDGSLRFDVEQISLRDVDQNEVAGVVRNPTLTMTLPETQLESLSVSVLYMDERAFTESVADPSLLVDWSVRMKTFRLIDVLRAP
jgi:hypothetical protein